jgi:3-oxoacyl-[acyl-carrier protein] reductase
MNISQEFKLQGKTVLITGATGGYGKSLSRGFFDKGATLILIGRNEDKLKKISLELSETGRKGFIDYFVIDLKKTDTITELANSIISASGVPDALINNAAIQGPIGTFVENDMNLWHDTMNINFFAPLLLCRAFLPEMLKRGSGKIINISGGGATGPRSNFSAYASSKAALVRFSETLAEEVKGTGIDINCIAPGALKTHMTEAVVKAGMDFAGKKEYESAVRLIESDETKNMSRAVELALYLASPESDGITGKLISAPWDPWDRFEEFKEKLKNTDIYTLRRIVPEDRGINM